MLKPPAPRRGLFALNEEVVMSQSWVGDLIFVGCVLAITYVLLFFNASARVDLVRDGDRVDARITRLILWSWIPVERIFLTGIMGAEDSTGSFGQHFSSVIVTSSEGSTDVTRLPVRNSNQAVAGPINKFLASPELRALTVKRDVTFGPLKMFGYFFVAVSAIVLCQTAYAWGGSLIGGFLTGTCLFLVPAIALLNTSSSTTLELYRNGQMVNAELYTHALFGFLKLSHQRLDRLVKTELVDKEDGEAAVNVVCDQGSVVVTPLVYNARAVWARDKIKAFIEESNETTQSLSVDSTTALAKIAGYGLLGLILAFPLILPKTGDGRNGGPDQVNQ